MRFRTTLILIILLAVIVLVIQQIGDQEKPAPTGPEPLLPGVNFGSVDRIECAMYMGNKAVLERQASGRWKVVEPYEDEADAAMVQNILTVLSENARVEVPLQEGATADLESKELDSPSRYIEIRGAGGTSRVNIGIRDPLGTDAFVTVGDSPVLYRTGANLLNLMEFNPETFRDTRLFRIDPQVVDRLILESDDAVVMQAQRRYGIWKITEPVKDDADSGRVQSLVFSLTRMKVEKIYAQDATPEILEECGFNVGRQVVTLQSGSVARTVILAPREFAPGGGIFCRRAESNTILVARRTEVSRLAMDLDAYRSRDLMPQVREKLKQVTVSRQGAVHLALIRAEGKYFHITEPFKAPADNLLDDASTTVSDYLSGIFSLQAEEIVHGIDLAGPAAAAESGLDAPQWSIVVRELRGQKVELALGREENGLVFARRSDKPRFVYTVKKEDLNFLDTHPLELRDRRPFVQDIGAVTKAEFTLGDRAFTIERAGKNEPFENDPDTRFQEFLHVMKRELVVRYVPEPSMPDDPRFADAWGAMRITVEEPGRGANTITYEFGGETDDGWWGKSSAIPTGVFILAMDFRARYAKVFEGL